MSLEPLMRLFDGWRKERLLVFAFTSGGQLMRRSLILGVNNMVLLITRKPDRLLRHGLCDQPTGFGHQR